MALFYERRENPDEIVIRYKYWFLFYIFIILAILLFFFYSRFITPRVDDFILRIGIVVELLLVVIILFLVGLWEPSKEIKNAQKDGWVKTSGSWFSLSNPPKFVIDKRTDKKTEK